MQRTGYCVVRRVGVVCPQPGFWDVIGANRRRRGTRSNEFPWALLQRLPVASLGDDPSYQNSG
jgi:hypothetical protein